METQEPDREAELLKLSLYNLFVDRGERIYVAIVPHAWGKGLSADQAEAECRRAAKGAGVPARKMKVLLMPPGAFSVWIDSMGNIHWSGAPGGEPEEVSR